MANADAPRSQGSSEAPAWPAELPPMELFRRVPDSYLEPEDPPREGLKKLTIRHLRILALYMHGLSLYQIALACRVSYGCVSRVIKDPLAVKFITRQTQEVEMEFQALLRPAIGTLRDGLNRNQMMKDRLRAASLYFQRRGDFKTDEEKRDTAEDVVARVLKQVNIQINVGGAERASSTLPQPQQSNQLPLLESAKDE